MADFENYAGKKQTQYGVFSIENGYLGSI